MDDLEFAAGATETQTHRLIVPVDSSWSYEKQFLTARFIEYWCEWNCQGVWRVEGTHRAITVSFESDADAVFFSLSPEYKTGSWTN